MSRLVIQFHPDGSVETLLKAKVFDARILGNQHVERVSIIEFSETLQKFYIQWLKGPKADELESDETGATLFFDTYEEAVEREVSEVNAMRLEGISFI